MNTRKTWILAFAVLWVPCLLCFATGAFAAKDKIRIRAATNVSSTDLMARTMEYFLKVLEEKSQGKIAYEMHSGGVMGKGREVHEAMKANAIQMFSGTVGDLAGFDPICDISNFPYLYKSVEHGNRVWDAIGPEFFDGVAKRSGWRILYTWVGAPRDLTCKKPITKPEDLKGLKVRVPDWPIFIKLWKDYFNASPAVISFGELYSALKMGVVDAQENPVYRSLASGFYDITPYNVRTEHAYDLNDVHVTEAFWQGLSPELQKIFNEAADEARRWTLKESDRLIKESIDEAKTKFGAKIIEPDLEAFRKAAQGIENDFPVLKDLVLKIRAIE